MKSTILDILLALVLLTATSCAQDDVQPGRDAASGDAVAGRAPAVRDTDCVLPPPTRLNKAVYNLPEYDTMTVELIRCLPDSLFDFVLSHYASIRLEALITPGEGEHSSQYDALIQLSPGLRMTWTTWWLDAETSNGGLDQYFFNTSGEFAEEAIAGLKLIGASKTAELTRKAYELWKEEQQRIERVGESGRDGADRELYNDRIDTLTTAFYNLTSWDHRTENLDSLRMLYTRAHPLEFIEE